MGQVVNLIEQRVHRHGEARCLNCGHKENSVAPFGVTWMECSACKMIRMRFVCHIAPSAPTWHCACGNDLFFITTKGTYCPNCGLDQIF